MEPLTPSIAWDRSPSPAPRASARAAYEAAFPPELRAPFDELFTDEVWVAVSPDAPDDAAGLVVLRRIGPERWAFVRYFLAARRGSGVGSAMFASLRSALGPDVRVVLDVEDPSEPDLPLSEVTVRLRRIAFYERHGLTVLPVRDYAPPHDDGHAPALLLLSTDATDVRHVVERVFEHRYHLPPDHPVVRAVVTASGLG